VQYNNYYYDPKSIMIIQNVINTTPNGQFTLSDAQAVATYQNNHRGLGGDGMVGENTLNVMVPALARIRAHPEAIALVTDFYKNVHETLSIRYDATVSGATVNFESGYLRVIRLGPQVFRRATVLRNAIDRQLAVPVPGHTAFHVPHRLNQTQVLAAISVNIGRIRDLRSIMIIQELTQTPISRVFDAKTCQHIAEYQSSRGLMLNPDGQIGSQRTLQAMVSELIGRGHFNAVIRLIIDYYNLSTYGALLDISVGPRTTLAGWIPGTTTLRIGRVWFRRSFPALVHQIAHMLDRVRTHKAGIRSRAVKVFLGESVEILSVGMPEESFPDFMNDARRALRNWGNMNRQEQRRYWTKFIQVRRKVEQRYNSATAAQQVTYFRLMQGYYAVVRP